MSKQATRKPRPPKMPAGDAKGWRAMIRKRRFWLISLLLALLIVVVFSAVIAWRTLVRMDARIQEVFEGQKWSIAARVYARPLELYVGQQISQEDLTYELGLLGYRRSEQFGPGRYDVLGDRFTVHTRGFRFPDGREPTIRLTLRWQGDTLAGMSDADGNDVPIARLEPVLVGRISPAQSEDRLLVTEEELPEGLKEALLSVEDPRFYEHSGISIRGILRAVWVNIREGRYAQGGSTLTQQLVKNLFLTEERSIKRKLTEWPMAMLLDYRYEKDEILLAYINEVFFAQDRERAVHGFGLASLYYFSRPLRELRTHEFAMLVGILKGPSYYNPLRHPERAKRRRDLVLQLMNKHGELDEEALAAAIAEPLDIAQSGAVRQQPAYLDLVRRQLVDEYDINDLQRNGLAIHTNFDPLVQRKLEEAVATAYPRIQSQQGMYASQAEELETAAVVSSVDTGEVVAMIGGREPRYAGFNRALDARRPIGSLIKPAVYLTALEQPEKYHLATPLSDTAIAVEQPDGSLWQPENFTGESNGQVSLLRGMSKSLNQATVNLGLELGVDQVLNTVKRLGYEEEIQPLPSALLGAIELAPVDVLSMYQTIAGNGFKVPRRVIRSIQALDGELLKRYPLQLEKRFQDAPIYQLQFAMQTVMRSGTGRRAYWYNPTDVAFAGKTGTSNDQRDSWFAGFGGEYLAVVWMGRDDNGATPVTGSSGALEVWSAFMAGIGERGLETRQPDDIVYRWTDLKRAKLVPERCNDAVALPYQKASLAIIEESKTWCR